MQTFALMYHDVVAEGRYELSGFQDPDANIYKLDRTTFRKHLETLAASPSRNRVALTFDDGGSGALEAANMLEEFGWRGRFFIITDLIGSPGFLSEAQIRELRRRGHEVGSHSCSHPARISHCAPEALDREWRESVRRLVAILGEPVTSASVPGGYYSRSVAAAAARTGIRILFTSEPVTARRQVDGCAVVGRFMVQQGTSAEWIASLASGRASTRLQMFLFWNMKKIFKEVGGESWLAARKAILARQEAQARKAAAAKSAAAGR